MFPESLLDEIKASVVAESRLMAITSASATTSSPPPQESSSASPNLNLVAEYDPEASRQVVEQTIHVTLDRINEIVLELYNARRGMNNTNNHSPLHKRLLARTFEMSPEGLRNAIVKQLTDDLKPQQEHASGKRAMHELVSVTVLDGVQERVNERLKEVSNFVADTILTRCLLELTQSLVLM